MEKRHMRDAHTCSMSVYFSSLNPQAFLPTQCHKLIFYNFTASDWNIATQCQGQHLKKMLDLNLEFKFYVESSAPLTQPQNVRNLVKEFYNPLLGTVSP